jgi:F-type H+-transporting ATPase subunit a
MPEQLWFTEILNRFFAGPATALLRMLHIEPTYPQAPITNAFSMELLVFLFLVLMFALLRTSLSVDNPRPLQHTFELLDGFVNGQSENIIGHHSERFTPFLATLALFILISNLIGLIPGLESPTASPEVPLGCALVAFLYYHAQGVRKNGLARYAAHFLGPQDRTIPVFVRITLAPVMLVVEPFSHLARVLSLTIRLYANMFAGDMIILIIFSLIPIGLPVVLIALHLGVALLQTYIFVLLTTVYLAGAVAEAH